MLAREKLEYSVGWMPAPTGAMPEAAAALKPALDGWEGGAVEAVAVVLVAEEVEDERPAKESSGSRATDAAAVVVAVALATGENRGVVAGRD